MHEIRYDSGSDSSNREKKDQILCHKIARPTPECQVKVKSRKNITYVFENNDHDKDSENQEDDEHNEDQEQDNGQNNDNLLGFPEMQKEKEQLRDQVILAASRKSRKVVEDMKEQHSSSRKIEHDDDQDSDENEEEQAEDDQEAEDPPDVQGPARLPSNEPNALNLLEHSHSSA